MRAIPFILLAVFTLFTNNHLLSSNDNVLISSLHNYGKNINKEATRSFNEPEDTSQTIRCYARYVPERKGDFAWENDKVAFRSYGLALREGNENSGIDCWLKRVEYSIINKWYAGNLQGISYHEDHGEGADNYHVGSSAGCGGTGIWINGQRKPLNTFTKYEILDSSITKTSFMLTYRENIDGQEYVEYKKITLDLGKRLFKVDSEFLKNGQPAKNLPICIGLTTHDGKAESFYNEENGWIACWEELQGFELGTGVKVDTDIIKSIEIVNSNVKDESHIFIIAETNQLGRLSYYAGYGWEKAKEISSKKVWKKYLSSFNEGLK